jgi:hypothetical protein
MYLIQQAWASLKYYRGFLTGVWLLGGIVVIYCLLV